MRHKKGFVALSSMFLLGTGSLFCQQYGMDRDNDQGSYYHHSNENSNAHHSDCCCYDCCPPADHCAKCAQLWPSCGPEWMITPGAGPCVDGCDIFITAEFIYWASKLDHSAFAVLQDQTGEGQRGDFKHPNWRMSPGFKVGIGYLSCHDGWDLYANYTWLRPRRTKATAKPRGDLTVLDLNYTFSNITNGDGEFPIVISNETIGWELDFNVVDLELGRNFYISQCLYLRPHFGLKTTWQQQRIDGFAEATQFVVEPTQGIDDLTSTGKHRLKYWAIGPRAGLDSSWHWNPCFSFLGEAAISALWSYFESTTRIVDANLTQGTSSVTNNTRDKFCSVKPVIELFLGIRWEDWWCCNSYYSSIDAGWEFQWWEGQNQFIFIPIETRWGDLGLQGLTIRARFQF